VHHAYTAPHKRVSSEACGAEYGEPSARRGNRVALVRVRLLPNPQCVELRLEYVPIDDFAPGPFLTPSVMVLSIARPATGGTVERRDMTCYLLVMSLVLMLKAAYSPRLIPLTAHG
jgi:hypothetical protein